MVDTATLREKSARDFTGLTAVVEVRAASFVKDSATGKQTVEVVLATDTPVRRQRWRTGPGGEDIYVYDEVLECTAESVDTTYLSQGMSVCDTHNTMSVFGVFGTVVPESIRYEGGKMLGTVEFNDFGIESGLAAAVEKRQIKFLSLQYEFVAPFFDMSKDVPVLRGKFMPFELSFVAVPADVNSQVRSKFAAALRRSKEQNMTTQTPPAATVEPKTYTAEEIAAAQAIVEAGAAAARAKEAPAVPVVPAVPAAPATTAEPAAARARTVLDAADVAVANVLTAARKFGGEALFGKVDAARSLGATVEEMREIALATEKATPQPRIDTSIRVPPEDAAAQRNADMNTFDSWAIHEKIKAARAKK